MKVLQRQLEEENCDILVVQDDTPVKQLSIKVRNKLK
jgi:hypothetical protein